MAKTLKFEISDSNDALLNRLFKAQKQFNPKDTFDKFCEDMILKGANEFSRSVIAGLKESEK